MALKQRVIRKFDRKDPMESNKKLSLLAKHASRSAIDASLSAGVAVVYINNGKLVREHPNREVEIIRDLRTQKFDLKAYLCQG